MTDHHITVGGLPVASGQLSIPKKGIWFSNFQLLNDPGTTTVTGPLKIGNASWQGAVTGHSFGEQWGGLIVGGKGKWSTVLPRKGYHNDAGVKPATVAADLARETGEQLGTIGVTNSLGANFARLEGTASSTLERIAGDTPWYVDRAGVTHIGTRPSSAIAADVLSFDPKQHRLEFVVDDLTTVDVGVSINDPKLPFEFKISALDIYFSPDRILCVGWYETTRDPIADSLEQIVRQLLAERLVGLYRYRVVQMVGTRVSVQAVKASAGAPDLLLIDQWPGVAGTHATLQPGGEVLVEFVQGEPVITHYVGGYQASPTKLEIGGQSGPAAARQGDAVEVPLPPAVFSGTIGGVPATGVLTFPLVKTLGTITAGSGKVKIAT